MSNLGKYFELNKEKEWTKWLKFVRYLSKGKQGIVGIFEPLNNFKKGDKIIYKNKIGTIIDFDYESESYNIKLDDDKDDIIINTNKDNIKINDKYVFKLSQYINHLPLHEYIIMKQLEDISYCPHFCKGFGVLKMKVDTNFRKVDNPFLIQTKYPIEKEVLLCQYIDKCSKFYNYIKSLNIHEDYLFSVIKQTLLALSIAQKEKKFTHYDLHSNNVMIKKCNKDLVFLYRISKDIQFCVPSLGYISNIIDYGYSFIDDMNDRSLFASLGHTDVGFTSDRFDPITDAKLFLVTVSRELKDIRKSKKSKQLRQVVKNIFYPLTIDWGSGWDKITKKSVADYVVDKIEKYDFITDFFKEYSYHCVDILQTLIILPLEEQKYSEFKLSFNVFMNEWKKIENEVSNDFFRLYLFKELIDVARVLRPYYMKKSTKNYAIQQFNHLFFETVSKTIKFMNLNKIHFEKLLCSLYVLSNSIEGMYYKIIQLQIKDKYKEYDKMLVKNIDDIYSIIETNFQDDYEYNENTQILIIDNVNKTNDIRQLPLTELDNINKLHSLDRGVYINDLFFNV